MARLFLCWLLALLLVSPGGANARDGARPDLRGLEKGGEARVETALDGDTLRLDDGRTVQLVGVRARKPPLSEDPDAETASMKAVRTELARIAAGKTVRLYHGGRPSDRHGRILAHLVTSDGVWIQAEMLRLGLVMVYSFRDNRALVRDMLGIEDEARRDSRGLWRDRSFAVLDMDKIGGVGEGFRIVEGRVRTVAERRTRTYLNFGEDWRTDFTISLLARDRRLFRRDGVKLAEAAGKRVRVRGWLRFWNGPHIEVDHPEQIEWLED